MAQNFVARADFVATNTDVPLTRGPKTCNKPKQAVSKAKGVAAMTIPKTMKTEDLQKATLVSLKFGTDPLVEEIDCLTGRELLTTDTGDVGTLVFVVRRPG